MAINKGTLGKLIDGIVQYIYPKTTADIVEYDKSQSVQQKIESIDKNIDNVNNRVTTITSGITAGNIQTKNDAELFDIRNPNINVVPKGTTYTSAGEAVRGQFGSLSDKIDNQIGKLYEGSYFESLSIDGEALSANSEEVVIQVSIYDTMMPEINELLNTINNYIISARDSAIALSDENLRYAKAYTDSLKKYVDEQNKTTEENYTKFFNDNTENVLHVNLQ